MALLDGLVAFWPLDDAAGASYNRDATGRGNNLATPLTLDACTARFCAGRNSAVSYAPPQQAFASLKGWGKWDRLLTTAEKAALYGGEYWGFTTTTSLQDAKAYYLLDETGGSASYADATGRGNTLTATGTTVRNSTGPLGAGDNATTLCTSTEFAEFTASIDADVMTVTAVASGTLAVGMLLTDTAIYQIYGQQTFITSFGTGSGGTGTYNVTTGTSGVLSQTIFGIKCIYLAKTTPGADLRSGSFNCTIAGWVNLNYKPTGPTTSAQQVFWGQLNNDTPDSGFNIYYDPTADRFCYDIDAGDARPLTDGAFIVANTGGSPSIGTWYFLIAEFQVATYTGTLSVNNGTPNTFNLWYGVAPTTGQVIPGNTAGQFPTAQIVGSFASRTSGWDAGGVDRPLVHAQNSDLQFGNNAKTVFGWFKLTSASTYQTLGGFYGGTGATTDWIIQQSANLLYFVFGLEDVFVTRTMNDTNYHFFIAWFDKVGNKIWLNIDNGTSASATGPATPQTVAAPFRLGCDASASPVGHKTTGKLDAWGICNGIPTAADISLLYNGGKGWEPPAGYRKIIQQAINRSNTY